jgi:hypothetical protein
VGLGDHDIVDDLQDMVRADPFLSPVGIANHMVSSGFPDAIAHTVRLELERCASSSGDVSCQGLETPDSSLPSDAGPSPVCSSIDDNASTSISAGSSSQYTQSVREGVLLIDSFHVRPWSRVSRMTDPAGQCLVVWGQQ